MSDFMSGGLGDKAKDLASEHGDTVGDFIDEKTGGKYSDQIDQVQEHLGVQDSGAEQAEQAEQAPQSQSGSEYGGQQAAEAGMGGQAPQEGSEFGQQAQGGSEFGQQAQGESEFGQQAQGESEFGQQTQGESGLDREQAAAQQAEQYGDQAAGTEYGETVAGQPEGFGGEQSDETAQGGSQFGGESQSGF
jgi:hypothetical protein